jgi:hypothetical protein
LLPKCGQGIRLGDLELLAFALFHEDDETGVRQQAKGSVPRIGDDAAGVPFSLGVAGGSANVLNTPVATLSDEPRPAASRLALSPWGSNSLSSVITGSSTWRNNGSGMQCGLASWAVAASSPRRASGRVLLRLHSRGRLVLATGIMGIAASVVDIAGRAVDPHPTFFLRRLGSRILLGGACPNILVVLGHIELRRDREHRNGIVRTHTDGS